MKTITLRKAVEMLKEQGINIIWDNDLTLDEFISYYDGTYKSILEDTHEMPKDTKLQHFLVDDIVKIFRDDCTFYQHIGTYHEKDDIENIFPSSTLKGDEADMVVYNYHGNMKEITGGITEEKNAFDFEIGMNTAQYTSNKQYIVTFIRGDANLLKKGSEDHGYYIDIWKRVE